MVSKAAALRAQLEAANDNREKDRRDMHALRKDLWAIKAWGATSRPRMAIIGEVKLSIAPS